MTSPRHELSATAAIVCTALLVGTGCATQVEERHRIRIRDRAPVETDCPEGKLRIETLKLDASSYRGLYRVKACGSDVEYVCTPNRCVPRNSTGNDGGDGDSNGE